MTKNNPSDKARGKIPEFASLKEEAEFWDSHDLTEFMNELRIVNPHQIAIEQNLSTALTVRLTPDMSSMLRRYAREVGIKPSTLARLWIVKQLQKISASAK